MVPDASRMIKTEKIGRRGSEIAFPGHVVKDRFNRRFISEVFKIVLFYKPQDVVVMTSSWCEDHASWFITKLSKW
ncbi:MAG: hypothetical protein JRH03_05485 [Deltaproteobacteria bacterium]|nr:hypothetical protein [Deltaproteobacteria bacterium]